MRIALLHELIGDQRGMSGNARLLLELANGLRDQAHDVVLVCHCSASAGNFDQLPGDFELRRVTDTPRQANGRLTVLRRDWLDVRQMADLVPHDVDVVNAHDCLRAGRIAAERLDVPLVWTRNDETKWERAIIPRRTSRGEAKLPLRAARAAFGLFDLYDARRADAIAVLSNHDAEMVRLAYGREGRVIRLGSAERFFEPLDRPEARARLGVEGGQFLVLAVALLSPHRRFEDLLSALAMLADDDCVVGLIVGSDKFAPAYADLLADRISRLEIGHRVTLHRTPISDIELRRHLTAADAFVFPSSRQSYGQAPLEALACGTPVIVSSGAGVHEVLAGRPGVRVVPPGRPEAIAQAIRELRASSRDCVRPTRDWLRNELTNAGYARAMAGMFESVCHRGVPEIGVADLAPEPG
ncbi:MAG: glycosyltransferase family 4 protein [Actinomycetota bacterium]|nr:glycosyltransferase family 4 protein [Actinomycetota bacterium]